MTASGSPYVYVGTYTEPAQRGKAAGIYVYRMDQSSGALAPVRTVPGIANPSFLAFDPGRRFLFACNETETFDGQPGGGVSAFTLDAATGDLTFLGAQPSRGTFPCHLCTDPTGRYLLTANYGSGEFAVHPIGPEGRLGAATDVVLHAGPGPHRRQEGPHAHMVAFDPAGRFALLVDLGVDRTFICRLDTASGKLAEHASAQAAPGAGPRHLAFHPSEPYVYILNEIGCTVDTFAWDAAGGTLAPLQTIPTLPAGFTGSNTTAEIAVHPSGRFVYASNRGHDSIAIFAVDAASGQLTARGHEPTGGKEPRSFAIDPTGAFLLAANQRSDTVATFRIDPSTGTLAPTGALADIPTPVCLLFG